MPVSWKDSVGQVARVARQLASPTPTPNRGTNTNTNTAKGGGTDITLPMIIGLTIGAGLILLLIGGGLFLLFRMRKRNDKMMEINSDPLSYNRPPPLSAGPNSAAFGNNPHNGQGPYAQPGQNFNRYEPGGLQRSVSTISGATVVGVDLENGKGGSESDEKGGWLSNMTRKATFKGSDREPTTPPLPMQAASNASPLTPTASYNPFVPRGDDSPLGTATLSAKFPNPTAKPAGMTFPEPAIMRIQNRMSTSQVSIRSVASSTTSSSMVQGADIQAHTATTGRRLPPPPMPVVMGMPARGRSIRRAEGHNRSDSDGSFKSVGSTATARAGRALSRTGHTTEEGGGAKRSRSMTSHELRRSKSTQRIQEAKIIGDEPLIMPQPVFFGDENVRDSTYSDASTSVPPVPTIRSVDSQSTISSGVSGASAPRPNVVGMRSGFGPRPTVGSDYINRASTYSSDSNGSSTLEMNRGRGAGNGNGANFDIDAARKRARSQSRTRAPGMI